MGTGKEVLRVRNSTDVHRAAEGLLSDSEVRTVQVEAIVDTGATYVSLPRAEIEKLGLSFHRGIHTRTANGRVTRRFFQGALIELKGRDFEMGVMESDDHTPPLIGFLLLEALDLVVDPKTGRVIPNPAHDGKWVADAYGLSTESRGPSPLLSHHK